MRTKALSPNQRIVIGVLDTNVAGEKIANLARVMMRVGLTLEVEERGGKELVLFAARRVSTADIVVEQAKPATPVTPIAKATA